MQCLLRLHYNVNSGTCKPDTTGKRIMNSKMQRSSLTAPGRLLILVLAGLGLAACSPVHTVRNVFDSPANWEFVQQNGGVRLGQPRIVDYVFWLPLQVDFSASGRKCLRASLRQADGIVSQPGYYNLYLQLYAGDPDEAADGSCSEVPMFIGDFRPPLANPERVTYRVYYNDYVFSEHLIGEVSL